MANTKAKTPTPNADPTKRAIASLLALDEADQIAVLTYLIDDITPKQRTTLEGVIELASQGGLHYGR